MWSFNYVSFLLIIAMHIIPEGSLETWIVDSSVIKMPFGRLFLNILFIFSPSRRTVMEIQPIALCLKFTSSCVPFVTLMCKMWTETPLCLPCKFQRKQVCPPRSPTGFPPRPVFLNSTFGLRDYFQLCSLWLKKKIKNLKKNFYRGQCPSVSPGLQFLPSPLSHVNQLRPNQLNSHSLRKGVTDL